MHSLLGILPLRPLAGLVIEEPRVRPRIDHNKAGESVGTGSALLPDLLFLCHSPQRDWCRLVVWISHSVVSFSLSSGDEALSGIISAASSSIASTVSETMKL